MADEHDPKRNTVWRYEHAGITSERFTSRDDCIGAAKFKLLAYPNEPVTVFASTDVLTVEDVTIRPVYPWYPKAETRPAFVEATPCDVAYEARAEKRTASDVD